MAKPQYGSFSKEYYEEIALRNSSRHRKTAFQINSVWKAKILRNLIHPIPVHSILEFGCGNAKVSYELAKEWRIDCYVGIDISETQIAYAKKIWPDGNFIAGNERCISSIKHKFDLALLVDIVEHLKEPSAMLSAVVDIAKYIAIKVPLEKTSINRIMKTLGLKTLESPRFKKSGHIHQWSLQDFLTIIKDANLSPISFELKKPPRLILFNYPTWQIMRRKPGFHGRINAMIYRILWFTPFPLVGFAYRCYLGTDLFIIFRPSNI